MTSRKESDYFQKQLAELRFYANNKQQPDFSPEVTRKQTNGEKHGAGVLTGRKFANGSEQTSIGGTLSSDSEQGAVRGDDVSGRSTSRVIAKCLRCNKLYNVTNKHGNACHYHTGRKRQVEKYDGRGRLICVTFVWQCCQRHIDAVGCNVGKHI